jgi:hypothetical protein
VAAEGDEVGLGGIVPAGLGGTFEGCADGQEGVGDQVITIQRCQEFQQVTWPLSRWQISFASWKSSSTRHLRHTSDTSRASVTSPGAKQR